MLGDWLREKRTKGLLWASSKTLSVRALSKLVEDIASENVKVHRQAVGALFAFISRLGKEEKNIAYAARNTLHELDAVIPLIALLEDRDNPSITAPFRAQVAELLGRVGDERAVLPLIDALRDPYYDVRGSAAWSLGVLHDTRAVEPLISALSGEEGQVFEHSIIPASDAKENVVMWAAEALGELGDTRAVEPLKAILPAVDFSITDVYDHFNPKARFWNCIACALEKLGHSVERPEVRPAK